MKKFQLYLFALLFVLFGVICVYLYQQYIGYYYSPIYVHIQEIARLRTGEELSGTLWYIICTQDDADHISSEKGIILPGNDYTRHFLLISEGRDMVSLRYYRESKWHSDYPENYVGVETFGNDISPHTYFMYQIDTIYLLNEEQAGGYGPPESRGK